MGLVTGMNLADWFSALLVKAVNGRYRRVARGGGSLKQQVTDSPRPGKALGCDGLGT